MTIRIPKWVLIAAGVVLIAFVAFLIGRGTGDDGDADSNRAAEAAGSAEAPPCNKRQAERLALHGPYSRAISNIGTITPPEGILDVYSVRVAGCSDLTGDGVQEMVVEAVCCTAESRTPWAH